MLMFTKEVVLGDKVDKEMRLVKVEVKDEDGRWVNEE